MANRFRILIVDDNANNLFALNAILARVPETEVVEAASGDEALLRTVESDIDLILLDVQMPGMDGFETARLLQSTERTRRIPIVFLTAVFKSEEFIRHGYEVGAVDYFTKPLDENLLLARIRLYMNLLQRERGLNAAVELLSQKEQAMARALNLAEAANRAKSTFLSNMSHELRTPLTAVIGLSHLMARSNNLGENERRNLEIINRSGNHLLSLINDVLEMSKIEAGRAEILESPADIGVLAREAVELLRTRAEQQGLTLTLEMEDVPTALHADGGKLRQVLVNLLGNAIKFTPAGCVTLRMNAVPVSETKVRLIVEVRDTGIGIAPEDQARIFEPFAQIVTHATTSGTGLGLSISRQFLQMMGSELAVESTPGVGSTFRFELILPRAFGPATRPAVSGQSVSLSDKDRGKRILVVDDNEDARYLLVEVLAPLGFDVQVAEDGEQAVARAIDFCPELILMDWRMPRMSGLEAAGRILALQLKTPPKILMLSANAFQEHKQQALAAGVDDFLKKPLQEEELFAALENHLCVRFLRSERSAIVPPIAVEAELAAADLDELSVKDRLDLTEAVAEVSQAKLRQVLNRIGVRSPQLARRLLAMTDENKHRELWELLGGR
jgi:signal transduction histidine kinase